MEQIVKLTGRIAKVFPIVTGTSARTGQQWASQECLFEYFSWGGAKFPDRLVARIFGEDRIKKINLQELEDNITVTLRFQANEYTDKWFNEIRIVNVERANQQQVQKQQDGGSGAAPSATAPTTGTAPFPPQVDSNGNPQNQEGEKDDLPF